MNAPGKALLERTRQLRKLKWATAVSMAGTALFMGAALIMGDLSSARFWAVGALSILLVAGACIYLCRSVRCPGCGARWIWLMASKRHDDPAHWDMRCDACSVCGEDARGGRPPQRTR